PVDVALRVHHERHGPVVHQVAAVPQARGVDRHDRQGPLRGEVGGGHARPPSSTHFSTRSASIGRVVGLAPTASSTALAIVDAHGPIGGSPMPRALNGPTPSPDSRTLTSISGQSAAVGMAYW